MCWIALNKCICFLYNSSRPNRTGSWHNFLLRNITRLSSFDAYRYKEPWHQSQWCRPKLPETPTWWLEWLKHCIPYIIKTNIGCYKVNMHTHFTNDCWMLFFFKTAEQLKREANHHISHDTFTRTSVRKTQSISGNMGTRSQTIN